ncbi:hypothetical protein, conserved [Plasmodium gonderi]|uniref:PH domain-containing protein n=1 Tax=Plasmodium gonderi TaxID=77519 RepID=A0A1Y1JEK9_PLAGO|nr:hypothetical protein, conserved [Plasmodium gonderi]GAW79647.1 hypothetical protein, conserved [Plasmodium gonderi]
MRPKFFQSHVFLSLIYFLLNGKSNCQSLLPVSYATHQLYSFDKLTPLEIKSNLKKTVGSFITSKLKDIKSKFYDYKIYGTGMRGISDGGRGNDNIGSNLDGEKSEEWKGDYDTSLEEEVKALLDKAQNKRYLSKRIRESHDRALKNLKEKNNGNARDEEKTRKLLEHNLEQINYLNKKSGYLENKAKELKKHLKSSKNKTYEQQVTNCNIYKTGKLKFVSSSNGLKHSIDNVQGKINNNGFTIFYKYKKKINYLWNILELPIKLIGSVEQCFVFTYKNSNQIFCTDNKLKTSSWVNSLTEASTCYHFGIKGMLVNINNVKNIKDKLSKNKKANNYNDKILIVDLKPDHEKTRVYVNGKQQNMEKNDDGVVDLNKIKKKMEDEKKISMGEENNPREVAHEDEVQGGEAQTDDGDGDKDTDADVEEAE